MKLLFLSYYYPPDLSAGSFRSKALVKCLSNGLSECDSLYVITSSNSRYRHFNAKASENKDKKVKIYRVNVPKHSGGIFSQSFSYLFFSAKAFFLCLKIRPDFMIGTSSRLMTAFLTFILSKIIRCGYYLDIRDIFSESFSDIFLSKKKYIGSPLLSLLIRFERVALTNASQVNVISQEFKNYFSDIGINSKNWDFFPNGVDKEFINMDIPKRKTNIEKTIVTYAGNIGIAQSLSSIIPEVARELDTKFIFRIIGDGTDRDRLEDLVLERDITNVEIIDPIPRSDLISYYVSSDILFLHLMDIPAFKRVLPSKIFEYGSIGKPIVAGLEGYSMNFLNQNLPHSIIFKPSNIEECIKSLRQAQNQTVIEKIVTSFREDFDRQRIMKKMSENIINHAKQ